MIDAQFAEAGIALADSFLSGKLPAMEARPLQLTVMNAQSVMVPTFYDGTDLQDTFKGIEAGSTVIIPIQGSLMKQDYCGDYGMQTLASLVTLAANEPKVKSIVLLMDTPGGSADGSLDLADAVSNAAKIKNTVAYIDGLCCSAGYRIASRANAIIAKPQSIIGSIGTMITLRFNDGQLAQRGIQEATINADGSPDKNADYLQAKIGNYTLIKESILNPMNDAFVSEIKAYRKNVDAAALTGKVFDSSKAKNLGLIDAEGMLQDAISLSNKSFIPNKKTSMNLSQFNIGQSMKAFFGFSETPELKQEDIDKMNNLVEQNANLSAELELSRTTFEAVNTTNIEQNRIIQEQSAKIAELEAKVAEYGALPGAMPTQVDKSRDDFNDDTQEVNNKGYVPEQAQQTVNQFSSKTKQ